MGHGGADKILTEWDEVTRGARRPEHRAQPTFSRTPPVSFALTALVVALAGVMGVWLAGPNQSGAPSVPSSSPTNATDLVSRAVWWVDPAVLPLPAETQVVRGFIREHACASGQSPEGRVLEPEIEYRSNAVVVTFAVRSIGFARCPGNPAYPVEIRLAEPLAGRSLLDGSDQPPRDATLDPDAISTLPPVDCSALEKTACEAVLVATLYDGPADRFTTFVVDRYVPACIRARLCLPPFGGYDADALAVGLDETGAQTGWKCAVEGDRATCVDAPEEDLAALATLTIVVSGGEDQQVVLRREGTTWSWAAPSTSPERSLTIGRWELMTINRSCGDCIRSLPPFDGSPPPDWCSTTFDAAPGERIDARITIRADAVSCQIDVSEGSPTP